MSYHSESQWITWIDELADRDYVVIDDFLGQALYTQIREFLFGKLEAFEQAGIGALDQNTVAKSIRGDTTYWLDRKRDQVLVPFWELVDETIQMLNRYCFLSLSGDEFHLTHYGPGSRYAKHVDQFANRNNRMISVVIYLNEGWQPGDGGELKVYPTLRNPEEIEPWGSRCVLFKSADLPHEVLKAHKNRYSLTGWLLYQPSALGKFLA